MTLFCVYPGVGLSLRHGGKPSRSLLPSLPARTRTFTYGPSPGFQLSPFTGKQSPQAIMALCGRLARRTPQLLRQRPALAVCSRSLTTSSTLPYTFRSSATTPSKASRQLRAFTKVAAARASSQEAPNAQAYLNSGAIAGARNLVDVKKVNALSRAFNASV